MKSISIVLLFLLASPSLQLACSSDEDCPSGDECYTVTSVDSSDPCTTSAYSTNPPAQVPYQECMDTDQEATVAAQTATCDVAEVSGVTACFYNEDCTGSSQCCMQQNCQDEFGSINTGFICADTDLAETSTASTNSCQYGDCTVRNYDPLNYPCSSDSDCSVLSSYGDNCCATIFCGDGNLDQTYCVPSQTGFGNFYYFNGCHSYCKNAQDGRCVGVPYDSTQDYTSQCAYQDNSTTTFCCAVITDDKNGGYLDNAQGSCQTVSYVDSYDNPKGGPYLVCKAVELLGSLLTLAASLFY